MFFRFRFWFRPKVKNILSVIHYYFNTWSKIHHNHILGLEEVLKTCKLKSSCYCDVYSEYEKYEIEDKFLTSLLAFLSNVTAPDNSEFMGKTFQAAQLTHERFLTSDSCKIFFLISAKLNFHGPLVYIVLNITYSTTLQSPFFLGCKRCFLH